MKKAATDQKRLEAADGAMAKGDISVASTIYLRIAARRPPNASSGKARKRLAELAEQGRMKLKSIDSTLAGTRRFDSDDARQRSEMIASVERRLLTEIARVSSRKSSEATELKLQALRSELAQIEAQRDAEPTSKPEAGPSKYDVFAAFGAYDRLAWQYAKVPRVGDEIRRQVGRQRRKPEFAAILKQPKALDLFIAAREHEAEGELCCAFRLYQEAAKLSPARSAIEATERLTVLKQDDALLALVETCRKLEWCHKAYEKARRLAKIKPREARKLFSQIVMQAPEDSEVSRAARKRI